MTKSIPFEEKEETEGIVQKERRKMIQ